MRPSLPILRDLAPTIVGPGPSVPRSEGERRRVAGILVAGVGLLVGLVVSPRLATAGGVTDAGAPVIAKYEARIPQLMAEQDIPGLSVALVGSDKVLWTEGFGHLDREGSARVTADTIFAVQSMSKNFTATAVMVAVGAGRLDLDAPIASYLPEFTVHSAFEEHPERTITLRMLLSHTAGLTMEAPIGNNYELDPGEFDEHVRSISDTWLRFPVGSGYAYSNLGIDLAGFILERTYGVPFAQVMHDLVLGPLGMDRSTFDRDAILAATDRALGHTAPVPAHDLPVYDAMSAAGGLFSSANDLARYLRFQLNDGSLDGELVLDPALLTEMRTVPAPHAGADAGYGLGVQRYRWHASANADLFSHGGGGLGWLADLWWSPPLGIGVAVLTNSADHHLQAELALSILADLAHEPGSVYMARLGALPYRPAADSEAAYQLPVDLADRVAAAAMSPLGNESERWARYAGIYRTPAMGLLDPTRPPQRFLVEAGVPYIDADDPNDYQVLVRHRLAEVQPGLFLAENGETLDFRGPVATWRNVDLVRVSGGPEPWQWVLLGASAVVAAWWLLAALVSTVRRRRGGPESARDVATERPRWHLLIGAAALLTSLLALATIAVLVVSPGLVESGFLGWLEVPLPLRLVLHLPLAMAAGAGCLVVLTVLGRNRARQPRSVSLRDLVLVVAGVALTAQLAAWHLIGWGLT